MEKLSESFLPIGFVVATLPFYFMVLRQLQAALVKTSLPSARKKTITAITLTGILGWMAFISALALRGYFRDFTEFPPHIIMVLLVPLVAVLSFTFSKAAKEILLLVPAEVFVRLQIFRILVEVLLWLMVLQNTLPEQMSFGGRNFDILTGLSAPVVAYLMTRGIISRRMLVAWNILGLLLLLNVVVIAVLSMPTSFRVFMNEPSNTIVAEFPYVWLPGLLVPMAYGLHFLSLRQLSLTK